MSDETTKKQYDPATQPPKPTDKVEDLQNKPISDQDAQSVKGGRAGTGSKIAL